MTDPYLPGHGDDRYHVTNYTLSIRYRVIGNRIDGDAVLDCVALTDVDSVAVDLAGLRVAKVLVDGAVVRFSHRGSRITIPVIRRLGEAFELRISYSGNPRPLAIRAFGEAGWEELADGVIVAAQPHGSPTWFPCNDRPSDKATYSVTISAPTGYYVAMGGQFTGCTRRGSSVEWSYRMRQPMAAYLATVQIGRYSPRVLPGGITVVAPDDVRGDGYAATFGQQPAMMAFFVDRFGPYPFDGYTCVITDDDLEIPLESQALSTFGRNFSVDTWDNVRLVAHELAHQWFGNAVTASGWRDIWLHEGFACYAEWLWSQQSGRASTQERARQHHKRLAGLGQDLLLADPGPERMFDDRVYKRGALTLHALRLTVGDETFFRILREWVVRFGGGNATSADFEALAAELSGQDLGPLFDAWLRSVRLPELPSPMG